MKFRTVLRIKTFKTYIRKLEFSRKLTYYKLMSATEEEREDYVVDLRDTLTAWKAFLISY